MFLFLSAFLVSVLASPMNDVSEPVYNLNPCITDSQQTYERSAPADTESLELYPKSAYAGIFTSLVNTEEETESHKRFVTASFYVMVFLSILLISKDYIDDNKEKVERAIATGYHILFKHYILVITLFILILYPLLLLSFII